MQPPEYIVPTAVDGDWGPRRLDQLCSLISRGTAPTYVERSSVRAIGQRCITNTEFNAEYARAHDENAMTGVLEPLAGDVLLNSTGTGTIGRSCTFNAGGRFIVDGHVTVMRPRTTAADGRWLNEILRSPWGQKYLEKMCYSGSTNQVELSRSQLIRAEVQAPSFAEQERIACILAATDDAIRVSEQLVHKLIRVKIGLVSELMLRGLTPDGCLGETPSGAGWPTVTLEVAAQPTAPICYGIVQAGRFVPDGPQVLTIGDLSGDFRTDLHRTSPQIEANYARSRVQAGDVVLSIKGTIGRVAVIPSWYSGNISRDLARVRLGRSMSAEFVKHYFLSTEGQARLQRAVVGTTRAEVSISVLKRISVPRPPFDEQLEISRRLDAVDDAVVTERATAHKLKRLKRGLADDLLSGKRRVLSSDGACAR